MTPVQWLKRSIVNAEARWFDLQRGVKTAGFAPLSGLTLASGARDGFDYVAARRKNVKQALRDLPVQDHSRFTFVDLGSGKGPVLFLAAEYPYRQIRGVEFARELHLQAVENIARFHSRKQRCRDLESIYMDVRDFEFPPDNLVIYLFNPFPPPIVEQTLANLRASLERNPREAFLISLFPDQLAPVFDPHLWLHRERTTPRHHIYRAVSF